MKRFLWWRDVDPDGLARAIRADAEADESLRRAQESAQWARSALAHNGFADALMTIMRGEAS